VARHGDGDEHPAFAADVFYNSLPIYGAGTTIAFVHPRRGLPVGHGGDILADPNGLTGVYGEPMIRPSRSA
jgi:hypothetical protein